MNQEFQLAIVTLAWGLLCLKELTLLFLTSELPCLAGFYSWCICLDPRVPNLDVFFFFLLLYEDSLEKLLVVIKFFL